MRADEQSSEAIRKRIQHELIHWMQYVLNSETKKTRGIFDNKNNLFYQKMSKNGYHGICRVEYSPIVSYLEQRVEFEP